ncbi:protein FAM117A [Vombatus ursinus]|uniref:protein FAM117A n=1 Tax=Vombatus ursinus TaxID=29139 RepID=UPI000FFD54BB|nr:protein FAM117A [Vombatus ursinus]
MAGAAAGGRGGGAWGPGRGGAGGLRRGCSPPAPVGSPRAGLQPLRATVPFQLQPPPHQRRDGGGRAASVPCSVAPEKSVCRHRPPRVRRTFSLDTILGSYLLGQWPKDADGTFTCYTNDKATQTPLSWHELEGEQTGSCTHKRSASWGSTDHRKEITKLKQQLQRTKLSRNGKEKERGSPIPGDHAVRGALRASPPGFPSGSPVLRLSPCLHRSLEGLNQELEEVFVKEQGEEELLRILDVPDGHRAPAPAQGSNSDSSLLPLEPGNVSLSPSLPLASPQLTGQASHFESRGATEELTPTPKEKARSPPHAVLLEDDGPSPVLAFASSPRPNHSYVFKREPPEGCEKVRAFEEAPSLSPDLTFLPSCPDKNKVHFNPTGSAFCPVSLVKPLFPSMGFLFRNCPTTPGSPCPSTAPSPFLTSPRKDPDAPKAPPLPFEPWQRTPPSEESVLFQSSLVV